VLGVVINYVTAPKGDATLVFMGVAFVTIAILVNAWAYKLKNTGSTNKTNTKGIGLAVVAGVLMAFFYRFIAASMDIENFVSPEVGQMTPYTAVFVFSVGILLSNFLLNSIVIKKPFVGEPTSYAA